MRVSGRRAGESQACGAGPSGGTRALARWASGVASGCSGPSGERGDGPREACGREERSWAEGMGRERREGARAGLRKGLGCLGWVLGFFSYFSFSISNSNSSQMNSNKFEFKL